MNVPQALTLAAEHERQQFESKGPTPASAQNQMRENDKTGIAAEYRVRLPSLTALTLSLRRDQHELFDDATTYRITAAQPIGQRVKLRASYGIGIANPTFFELFGFIPGQLRSESGFEAGRVARVRRRRGFRDRQNKDGCRSPTLMPTSKTKLAARSMRTRFARASPT